MIHTQVNTHTRGNSIIPNLWRWDCMMNFLGNDVTFWMIKQTNGQTRNSTRYWVSDTPKAAPMLLKMMSFDDGAECLTFQSESSHRSWFEIWWLWRPSPVIHIIFIHHHSSSNQPVNHCAPRRSICIRSTLFRFLSSLCCSKNHLSGYYCLSNKPNVAYEV